MPLVRLKLGDSLVLLKDLPDASIDAVITDPPYGLEFMGEDWDAPWKYSFGKHGFSDGAERVPAPNFTPNTNPTCQTCGKRERTWKGGPDKCVCEAPDWNTAAGVSKDKAVFQAWCEEWLRECHRVLKPGGVIKAFSATRTFHRLVSAMENVGFELRPGHCLEGWLYGQGFPKYLNTQKAVDKLLGEGQGDSFDGWATALKPGWEPFIIGYKPGG